MSHNITDFLRGSNDAKHRLILASLRFRLCPAGHRRCHPEWSEAESNFFVRDPKLRFAPFDPRYARISATLRMTRTKKHRATRGGISAGIWLGAINLLRQIWIIICRAGAMFAKQTCHGAKRSMLASRRHVVRSIFRRCRNKI